MSFHLHLIRFLTLMHKESNKVRTKLPNGERKSQVLTVSVDKDRRPGELRSHGAAQQKGGKDDRGEGQREGRHSGLSTTPTTQTTTTNNQYLFFVLD